MDEPLPVTVPWLYGRIPYTVRCEALGLIDYEALSFFLAFLLLGSSPPWPVHPVRGCLAQ